MNHLVEKFLKKVTESNSLEAAKAFAEASLIALEDANSKVVILEGFEQGRIIDLIKALRTKYSWGLKETKDYVESCPKRFPALPPGEAEALKRYLEQHGGKARVQ